MEEGKTATGDQTGRSSQTGSWGQRPGSAWVTQDWKPTWVPPSHWKQSLHPTLFWEQTATSDFHGEQTNFPAWALLINPGWGKELRIQNNRKFSFLFFIWLYYFIHFYFYCILVIFNFLIFAVFLLLYIFVHTFIPLFYPFFFLL